MSWRWLIPLAAIHITHPSPLHSTPSTTLPEPDPLPLSPTQPPSPPLPDFSSSYYPHLPPPPSSTFPLSSPSSPLSLLLRLLTLHLVHGLCSLHLRFTHLHLLPPTGLSSHLPRPPHTALLTLSNHSSTIDDPYLITALTPYATLTSPLTPPALSRWSWCTTSICFTSPFRSTLFRLGRILPITRGAGIHQPHMLEALAHLVDGHWLHVFPQGRCVPYAEWGEEGEEGEEGGEGLKWGAAKLVVDLLALGGDVNVVVWMHEGMEGVMPLRAAGWGGLPRVGKEVWVMVGEEEVEVKGVVERWRRMERANMGWGDPWPPPEEELYKEVAQVMEAAMRKTGRQLRRRVSEHRAAREAAAAAAAGAG